MTIFFETALDFAAVSYILWIIFVVLMPVLLTNLLVSGWGCTIDTKLVQQIIVAILYATQQHKYILEERVEYSYIAFCTFLVQVSEIIKEGCGNHFVHWFSSPDMRG